MGAGAAEHHAQGGGHEGDSRVGVQGELQGKDANPQSSPLPPFQPSVSCQGQAVAFLILMELQPHSGQTLGGGGRLQLLQEEMRVMMEGQVQLHGSTRPAFWNKLESLKKIFKPKTHQQRT